MLIARDDPPGLAAAASITLAALLWPLLAVTANSPITGGHDTGWTSWRYPTWSRWPTAVPTAAVRDAAAYDPAVGRLIGRGAALDERSIYFLARLSPRYPGTPDP